MCGNSQKQKHMAPEHIMLKMKSQQYLYKKMFNYLCCRIQKRWNKHAILEHTVWSTGTLLTGHMLLNNGDPVLQSGNLKICHKILHIRVNAIFRKRVSRTKIVSLYTKIQKEHKPQLTKQTSSSMTNSSASYKPQKEVLKQNIGIHLYIYNTSLTHSLRNLTCKTFSISSNPLFRENTFQKTGGVPQVTYQLLLQHCMYYYEQILFTHTCTDTQIIFQNIRHLY